MRFIALALGLSLVVPSTSKPFESLNSKENEIYDEIEQQRREYGKLMLSYMNQNVNPCEDFYEYACGNWKNAVEEKSVEYKRSSFFEIFSYLVNAFDGYLQGSLPKSAPICYSAEFELARRYYNTCLSADLITPRKSTEYLEIIKEIGGFPAVDDAWNPNHFSWFNMSSYLTNYGVHALLNEDIYYMHPFPPVFVKKPQLGFGYPVYSDNIQSNLSNAWLANDKKMRKYLTIYGVNETKSTEVISQIFEFWKAFLVMADKFDNDFSSQCPEMDSDTDMSSQWDSYFDIAWNGKQFGYLADEYTCVSFYTQLNEICENHKYAVANYLAMQFLYEMDTKIGSINDQKEYCVGHVRGMATHLLDLFYLQEFYSFDINKDVIAIVEQLKDMLRYTLKENDWLDEETKSEALLKASAISPKFGFMENPLIIDQLIKEMNNLSEGSFEENNIQVHKFKTAIKRYLGMHSELFDNSTRPINLYTATDINAFYFSIDNSINIMPGTLHPPVYQLKWPKCLKLGTLGFLIGHELTHAYETNGRDIDINGEIRDWRSQNSSEVYKERASCFSESYSDFFIPEINHYIDGKLTEDENIADNGGLRQAFMACRKHLKEATADKDKDFPPEETIPGMNYSAEQLFFLGFSQLWCSAYKEEHLLTELIDPHTIDKYRVLGALKNSEEFAQVFECPIGSKMNPHQEKCRLI